MSPSELVPESCVAYLNGNLVPYREAAIPVWDLGFTMGVSLTERLRTYAGELPLWSAHLDRLMNAASLIGIADSLDPASLTSIVESVVRLNWPGVAEGGDLSVGICVTPGKMDSASPPNSESGPTLLVTALPLDLTHSADGYQHGIRLVTVSTREVPAACLPKSIKHRNRLHYYLAEREARAVDPAARALLLQVDGDVAEGTTAAVAVVQNGQLQLPPGTEVQQSIVRSTVASLAAGLDIEVVEQNISPGQLQAADEVLWLSSPVGVLPVTWIDGLPVGEGRPGPMFQALIERWSLLVGVNLVHQAVEHASGQA